ncbi:hypothetical protein IW261DRAFT_1461672 [Armillaria novae-zelandiae]|uniref:Uncharacterized protein n=1 Tax=Armillaria novae-zelandiae TaxID=153914 RepID=A0AA39PH33_9AGAR|nr:hypothetical protein IW261DRAFT_1461672 [Armillaria novae-zelandiae]
MIISYAAIMISYICRDAHSKSKGETLRLHPNILLLPSISSLSLMFLSLFQLCFLAATFSFSLSLDIFLPNSTPIVNQSTQIFLSWMSGDPQKFNIGVYLASGGTTNVLPDHSHIPVHQVVTNFTQNQNVTITFNATGHANVKNHILMAWSGGSSLAYSHWFAVDGPSTPDMGIGGGTIPSPIGSSAPVAQTPAPAGTEEATSSAQTKTTSRTGAIVGGVLGSFAFLSIISGLVLFMLRRRRRARNSAPSRVFWKYLDEKKGPPRSSPPQYPSPTYSPGVQARPLSLLPEDYYHGTK